MFNKIRESYSFAAKHDKSNVDPIVLQLGFLSLRLFKEYEGFHLFIMKFLPFLKNKK